MVVIIGSVVFAILIFLGRYVYLKNCKKYEKE